MQTITIHTDGGARGNPGPSGIGVSIADDAGVIIHELSEYIGEGTNNVAEYTAVQRALEILLELFPMSASVKLDFFLDSQLVERQLNGIYKIKDTTLRTYAKKIDELRERFYEVTFTHVRREENARADELANDAMDKVVGSRKREDIEEA